MAWISLVTGAVSLLPSVYKGIQGISQTAQANGMHPIDPGYQMNRGVLGNAKTVSDIYGNYQMPGYTQAQNDINTNFATGFNNGVQGASSGSDVLDLAAKLAYGKNKANQQLNERNAQGKQDMLGTYLNTQAAAGKEYQNQNQFDNQRYQQALEQKAALTQAGQQNTYGAIDQLSGAAAGALSGISTDGNDTAAPPLSNNGGYSNTLASLGGNPSTLQGNLNMPPNMFAPNGEIDPYVLKQYIQKAGIR